jgi:hypothetical protein
MPGREAAMADEEGTTDDAQTEELGDGGKKALDAERTRARNEEKARKAAEKRATELEERLAKVEADTKTEGEKALEAARKEASDTARAEERTKAARRILTSEVKAAAGGKLADPLDAVRLLDLDEFSIDDEGEVDAKSIAAAIDGLLKEKPYLAANRSNGSADGGARTPSTKLDDSPRGLITAGLAANESARTHR